MSAHLERTRRNHRQAVEILDVTTNAVLEAEPPRRAATRTVRKLSAQKAETEAVLFRPYDAKLARDRLQDAADHYEFLGFDRSLDRVRRKLDELVDAITSSTPADSLGDVCREAPDAAEWVSIAQDRAEAAIDIPLDSPADGSAADEAPDPDRLENGDYVEVIPETGDSERSDW